MDTVYIYALCEPDDTEEIRYVGATQDIVKRMKGHIKHAASNNSMEKNYPDCGSPTERWIGDLLKRRLLPIVLILEETTEALRNEAEHRWIAKYRDSGARLTNKTYNTKHPWDKLVIKRLGE